MAEKTSGKQVVRNDKGQVIEGTPNPNGRPKGQRNYTTIYREALIKIAESKGITAEELEEQLEQVGIYKALKGDLGFHKDIKDRVHGKALQKTDITSAGEQLQGVVVLPEKEIGNADNK